MVYKLEQFLDFLVCPQSRSPLKLQGSKLISQDSTHQYDVNPNGIPLFAKNFCTQDAKIQQELYDGMAGQYIENLTYPHTEVYMDYLDAELVNITKDGNFDCFAEICCGGGEALELLKPKIKQGIGVDISEAMLNSAQKRHSNSNYCFIQGDATNLPLEDNKYDSVAMLGGIHHVNDRDGLFKEIFRILKPGGVFYFREPVSDFLLWRFLRYFIYKFSSYLDETTESPLRYNDTVPVLEDAGFKLKEWKTLGSLGYCFFFNSDVLIFNRCFRFIPGIRAITKCMTYLDRVLVRLCGKKSGLVVVGSAEKPK